MREAAKVTLLVFVLQTAALIGTAALFGAYGGSIAHEISMQDAREAMLLADSLIEDGRFHLPSRAEPETWRTPGYPAFAAAVFAVTGSSLAALLVVLALVGAVTSGLIYLIGQELGLSHRWSFAAGLFFGISPAVIWVPPSGMGGDIVFIFVLTAATYLVLRHDAASQWWFPVASVGALLGVATLVRPIGFYFSLVMIAALPFFAVRTNLTKTLQVLVLAGVAFFLVLTPWMARNYVVADRFSLSSQFALNPFYYHIPIFLAWENGTNEQVEREKLLAVLGKRDVYEDVYSLVNGFAYYEELAALDKQFLKENFVPYTLFHLYKTIPFFVGSGVNVIYATITNEVPNIPDVPFFPRAAQNTASLFYGGDWGAVLANLLYYWPSTLERLVWLALFVLAFVAPFVTEGRARRFAILGVILVLTIALLASPIAQPRYRIPAEPFIWPLAALTLSTFVPRLRLTRLKSLQL